MLTALYIEPGPGFAPPSPHPTRSRDPFDPWLLTAAVNTPVWSRS
jgi:hypothetical protein